MLKSFPKILTILFLTIFIFQLACLVFLFTIPQTSQAADSASFKPQVEIPGMKEEFGAVDKTDGYAIPGSTASIAKYVRVVYKYAIGIVGILAAVVLMIGGVMWIIAGGSATQIGEAKAWIGASLTGLVLALLSYVILATINPALVDFKTTGIKQVEQIYSGCCEKTKSGGTCSTLITQTECESEWRQGTYNCNNLGKCVFSIGVCCLTGGVCSYVNLAPNCSGTKLYGQNCCSQCTISWYKNNVDSSINACSEITATGDGSF